MEIDQGKAWGFWYRSGVGWARFSMNLAWLLS